MNMCVCLGSESKSANVSSPVASASCCRLLNYGRVSPFNACTAARRFTSRRRWRILYKIMELARPTMKRKEPLTAAPAERLVVAKATSMAPTYNTADAPNPVYMLVDVGRDGDGDVLRMLWVSCRAWGI